MADPVHHDYDAVVIGGGPAGTTVAILLAQAGQRVAVVEKARFPRRKVCGEFISATTWPLLRELGVADLLHRNAGPRIRRVGLYAGPARFSAAITTAPFGEADGGCAVGRDVLDTVLMARARSAGASVWQPWTLVGHGLEPEGHCCAVEERGSGRRRTLTARVLIAAHGSWESGPLPSQDFRGPPRPSDLLAFKGQFSGGHLPADLMPLLAFPGGYGGMVSAAGGRISLSCCIRRDQLAACRKRWPRHRAGDAVLAHLVAHCAGAAAALSGARLESSWLAAGPVRPGVRSFGSGSVFVVGNAAAEAHSLVAEGISMAIQSAALLSEQLATQRGNTLAPALLASWHSAYASAWRRKFLPRMHAAWLFAKIFTHPASTRLAVALVRRFPRLLALGARFSGKSASAGAGAAA